MVLWEIIITTIIMKNFLFGVCYEPSTMLSTSYTSLVTVWLIHGYIYSRNRMRI